MNGYVSSLSHATHTHTHTHFLAYRGTSGNKYDWTHTLLSDQPGSAELCSLNNNLPTQSGATD